MLLFLPHNPVCVDDYSDLVILPCLSLYPLPQPLYVRLRKLPFRALSTTEFHYPASNISAYGPQSGEEDPDHHVL